MVLLLKRRVAALLCIAMILGFLGMIPQAATTVNAVSTNLLADNNYSFENAIDGTVKPTDWTLGGAVGDRASLNAEVKYDKNYSLMVDNTDGLTIGIYSAFIPVIAGDEISASVAMSGGDCERGFFLRFYETTENFTLSSHIGGNSVWYKGTAWATKTITATVPAGAKYARVILYAGSNAGRGVHYFDNVVVTNLSAPQETPETTQGSSKPSTPAAGYPDDNMLQNYNFSFEDTVSGGIFPLHWTNWNVPKNEAPAIVATDKYTGNSSLLIKNNNPNETIGLYSAYVPVTPGETLSLTMYVKGTGEHGAFLRFYEDNTSGKFMTDGQKSAFKTSSADWTSLTVTSGAVVPEGANYVRVLLWMGESGAGEHYFDNIILKKINNTPPVGPSDPGTTPPPSSSTTPSGPFPLDNVLQNYNFSFEETATDSTFPLNWFNWNVPKNDAAAIVTTEKSHGNSSLLIKNNDPAETIGLYSVYFPVTAGDVIKVSADVKGTGEHGIVLRFFESTTSQSHMDQHQKQAYKSNNADWAKLTVTSGSVVPEGATVARILLWMGESGAGEHYYDNIVVSIKQMAGHRVTAVPAKAPTLNAVGNIAYWSCECGKYFADEAHETEITDKNAVVLPKLSGGSNLLSPYNPSFEWGEIGGVPVGWTDYGYSRPNYTVSTDTAKEGTKALKLTIAGTEDSPRGIYSGYMELTADMEALSVLMSVKGEGDAMFYMYYYNEKMERIPNVEGDAGWIKESATPAWTDIYAKFPVPAGAKYARILLYRSFKSLGTIYFDNITVKKYEKGDGITRPKEFYDSFESGTSSSGLPWGWTYYTQATANTADFKSLVSIDVTKDKLPDGFPVNDIDGKYVLMFAQEQKGSSMRGIYSPYVDVSGMEAVMAGVQIHGPTSTQIYIMFYDEDYKPRSTGDWKPWAMNECLEDWATLGLSASVPAGAKYARLMICKSYNAPYNGVTYLESAFLKETTMDEAGTMPLPGELVEYDWAIVETEHPRVFFDKSGLRRIKKFAANDTLTSMGYSGKDAYTSLIKDADMYMKETYWIGGWGGDKGIRIKFPLHPVLEDPSCREEFTQPPAPGYSSTYPYMTNTTEQMMRRMKVLALAYAISGNEAYGERAVQYATDMSKWKYWVGEHETIINSTTYDELSAQPTGYCVIGVTAVYDMCYNLLTSEEKTLIENALITKGLEPMYHDCMPRMLRGRDMDHAGTIYLACAAIMREDNLDQLSKYLNMVMLYTDWIFDCYQWGHNEGYDYAASGIVKAFEGMDALTRVTGMQGNFEHVFVTDTFPDWVIGFAANGNGVLPGFSDSPYWPNFQVPLAVLARRGNSAAGYVLTMMGGGAIDFEKLIYTNLPDDYIEMPEKDFMNVTVVDPMGIGSLRTGWGAMDKLMVLFSDDYGPDHAHWECNSLFMAMDGAWLIRDVGYGSITKGFAKTDFDQKYAVNSIFIDGKPQSIKGQGKVEKVVDSHLYGHIVGSAPGAYGTKAGTNIVDKFDRHAIMMNHDSESYYVIIDDLASTLDHVYGFNIYQSAWDRLELDGKEFDTEKATMGNHLSLLRGGKVLHYEFVGEPLKFTAPMFTKSGETFGPLLRAEGEKSKNYQFMTVISVDPEYDGIITIDSTDLLTARSSKLQVDNPKGFSWSSSNNYGMVIGLPVDGVDINMFRAGAVGDWMSFPFEVEEGGEYLFSLKLGAYAQYGGKWQAYLDGEPIGKPYNAKSNENAVIKVEMGKVNLTAGTHTVKMELIGDVETADPEWGTLISMGIVVLEIEGSDLGYGATKVAESYKNDSTLGAKINYGTVLSDIILSRRGEGLLSGGNLTSDGAQASILGLYQGDIKEGFAVVSGTSLKYGDLVLMAADGLITLSADYRLAKVPVKNTDDDEPLVLDEDFKYDKPTTWLSTSAAEARVVSVQVGTDAPFVVYIDGEKVESNYADGLLTIAIPEGEHKVEIVGTHHCVFDRYEKHIKNVKTWASCLGGTTYYVSCYCGKNGTETFQDNDIKPHVIVAVNANEPTDYENGNIAHFKCNTCGKLFADAQGTQELKYYDVVLYAEKAWVIWVIVGCSVVALGAAVFCILKFKFGFFSCKKKQEELTTEEVEETEPVTEEDSE